MVFLKKRDLNARGPSDFPIDMPIVGWFWVLSFSTPSNYAETRLLMVAIWTGHADVLRWEISSVKDGNGMVYTVVYMYIYIYVYIIFIYVRVRVYHESWGQCEDIQLICRFWTRPSIVPGSQKEPHRLRTQWDYVRFPMEFILCAPTSNQFLKIESEHGY